MTPVNSSNKTTVSLKEPRSLSGTSVVDLVANGSRRTGRLTGRGDAWIGRREGKMVERKNWEGKGKEEGDGKTLRRSQGEGKMAGEAWL